MNINSYHLLIALCAGVITYLIRSSFVGKKEVVKFSKLSKTILNHIPTACFSALIISMLLITPSGLNWDFYKISASIIALLVGLIYRNLVVVILCGMLCFWLLKALF